MSFYSDASLTMIPSGIKDQKVYSVTPTDGSGDLTFSRASNATRVNSSGLVEKVRTNQALYSEDFTNANWLKTNATLTGNTIANPLDGALTADTFTPTNVSGTNRIRSASISLASAGMSIYVKANGYTKVGIREDITTGNYASYDLSSGSVLDSSGVVSPTITALTNGWYRISLGVTASPVGMGVWILDPTYTSGTFSTSSWTANGTSGIYVFGAQIEEGDIATDYIATTSAAVSVGPVSGLPRLDYSGGASCPSLLLEPQTTNVITYNCDITNGVWDVNTGITRTANTTETTAPTGYYEADKFERTTNAVGYNYFRQSIASANNNTFSFFVKKGNWRYIGIRNYGGGAHDVFDLDTQTFTNNSGSVLSYSDYGNGWYRISSYSTASTSTYFGACLAENTSGGEYWNAYEKYAYFWGFQAEAKTYPTSVITTLGASVTRVADSASKTGISSLIGQTEGTLFIDVVPTDTSSFARYISISAASGVGSGWIGIFASGSNTFRFYGDGWDFSAVAQVRGTRYKVAMAYKNGVLTSAYVNGTSVGTLTANTTGKSYDNLTLASAPIGNAGCSDFFQSIIFPTALSNADLATLTTL